MKEFWNERYSRPAYAYGTTPNKFFETQLPGVKPGSILMPGDGEGRNGVYAAKLGWKVTCADLSKAGRTKALALADANRVSLDYRVVDIEILNFEPSSFDAIALIYAHFAASRKAAIHQQLHSWLKPGGIIILEAFRKAHLEFNTANPNVGGPKELGMLYSPEELFTGFPDYEVIFLDEPDIRLQEGIYHDGTGAVIRYVGQKPNLKL